MYVHYILLSSLFSPLTSNSILHPQQQQQQHKEHLSQCLYNFFKTTLKTQLTSLVPDQNVLVI